MINLTKKHYVERCEECPNYDEYESYWEFEEGDPNYGHSVTIIRCSEGAFSKDPSGSIDFEDYDIHQKCPFLKKEDLGKCKW